MNPVRSLALGVAGAALLGLTGYATASSPRVHVTAQLPTTGRAGTAARVQGRAAHAPTGAIAELERAAGLRWIRLAAATISHGRFALSWTPPAAGFLTVRVVVVRRHVLLAKTPSASLLVGAAPVYCAPPQTPADVPPGDGTIVGGVYNEGGPAPGVYVCQGQANTVTLTSAAGASVATKEVAAGQSYAFVVPAGGYTLAAGYCRAQATVTAGRTTHTDTVCPVP
jgi:hypothetical protein